MKALLLVVILYTGLPIASHFYVIQHDQKNAYNKTNAYAVTIICYQVNIKLSHAGISDKIKYSVCILISLCV